MNTDRELLMEEAKALGLAPHHSTGEIKLQEMIDEALSAGEDDEVIEDKELKLTKAELKLARIQYLRKVQRKVVRVIVRCNNDMKKELTGETHTVICAAGTLKKWVPFDNEEGWHVPQAILDVLESKRCVKFKNGRLKNGQPHKISYLAKEYTIEKIKPLSKADLKKLASEQAARGSID